MGELWDTKAFQAGNRSCKGLEAELWMAYTQKSKEAKAEGPSAGQRAGEESQEEAGKALKVL